jgi:DEAD/DEAH box helicase domain-containing protein
VSLRRLAADNVVIVDHSGRPEVIGEMDQFSAQVMLHEETIYLHDGRQYHVDRLDWEEKTAYVRPVEVDYYTDALLGVSVSVLEIFERSAGTPWDAHHGEVKLQALATMFKKIRLHTHEDVGSGPIHLPEQHLQTTAYWTTLSARLGGGMEAGLQDMAHALRTVAALRLMCDPQDLDAVAEVRSPSTLRPTATVYDVYPGGVGYA